MRYIWIISLIFLFSCKGEVKEKQVKKLTETEKAQLKEFGNKLTTSLNKYEYDLIRNSWNNAVFRKRVRGLNKAEQTVFDHYFDKDFGTKIKNENIDLVNKIKFNEGRIYLNKIIFYPTYAELVFTLQFLQNIDFWKYRVELINNTPRLTDYYSYRDELWQSENMKNLIRLNARYTAGSKERTQVNRGIMEAEEYLRYGDSLSALESLYKVPETHLIGNGLSLKRIRLAYEMGDSIFAYSLEQERKLNKSIYIRYLYGYFFYDTLTLNNVFSELKEELGISNQMVDSLVELNYFWN